MRALLEVVRLSAGYIGDRGSGSPRLDAELLAAHALGLRRLDVYLQHDRPLGDAELAAVRELVRRRGAGEPVAYIVGTREFYGRQFVVTPAVLIPRPETETLVERMLAWARATAGREGEGLRLADLGTGSGCIACTLAAELPGAQVEASDLSAAALEVARRNAERLGVGGRVRLSRGSWAEAFADRAGFDGVVSNPPYVTSGELAGLERDVADFEPHLALDGGEDGLAAYQPIVEAATRLLRDSGFLAVEVDHRRADAVVQLLRAGMRFTDPVVTADLSGRPRVVEAVAAA